nr:efflux pump fub11 [Quercus suber]
MERSPEDRMQIAKIGGLLFPVTMFWFAWTAEFNSIHWIVPTLAGVFLSTSILMIFVSYLNYLTDSYLMFAASALAANTVCRSACGAAAPLFTNQMFSALGVGGGGSLIAGVACLLAPIPFIFSRYGESIRRKSRFAPTDKQPPSKVEDEENKTHPEEDAAARRSEHSASETEDHESEDDGGDRLEKDQSRETDDGQKLGDRFLNADGIEAAE